MTTISILILSMKGLFVTFRITTLSIKTLSITTLSKMTPSIKHKDTQHNDTQHYNKKPILRITIKKPILSIMTLLL